MAQLTGQEDGSDSDSLTKWKIFCVDFVTLHSVQHKSIRYNPTAAPQGGGRRARRGPGRPLGRTQVQGQRNISQ